MLLHPQPKQMSSILSQAKQCFVMHRENNFWFAPLLSLSNEIENFKHNWDINQTEYVELLKIFSSAIPDMTFFYKNSATESAFSLAKTIDHIFNHNYQDKQITKYAVTMSRVHFNNNLALLLIKNKQYKPAFDRYQSILQVFQLGVIDTNLDIFLVSISNYLSMVKLHRSTQYLAKIRQLVQELTKIYKNLLDKYSVGGCMESNLLLLLGVFKKHELYLKKYKAETILLIKKYEEAHSKQKERESAHQFNSENYKLEQFYQKNKSAKLGSIQVKISELYFTTISENKSIVEKSRELNILSQTRGSIQFDKSLEMVGMGSSLNQSRIQQQDSLLKVSKKIQQEKKALKQGSGALKRSILRSRAVNSNIKTREKFTEAKKEQNDQKKIMQKAQALPVYQSAQLTSKNLSTLKAQTSVREKVIREIPKLDPNRKTLGIDEQLVLNVNFSLITIKKDCITFSDYFKKDKSYITWQQALIILQSLRYSYVFTQFLPICCYYDIGRILSYYVYQPDNNDPLGVVLLNTPKQLVKLNVLSKLYFVEGKYMKLFVMNHYGQQHIQIAIDCYFQEFQQLFKNITKDEYIQYMNSHIFDLRPRSEEKVYAVEAWTKRKQTTALELENQIKIHEITQIPNLKYSQFKILLILPKKVQLLVYLRQKDLKEEEGNLYMPLTVYSLQDGKDSRLRVPMYRIHRFFPVMEQADIPGWMKRFGKLIFEGYSKCFLDYPYSFNNMQFMTVITYATKIQMIPTGKYYAPIAIEVIGSASRIWGLCIRFFEQANIQEKCTFIYNPYYDLLAPLIRQSPAERKKFLLTQLVEGSVGKTYKILQKNKLENTMIHIKSFWNLIGF